MHGLSTWLYILSLTSYHLPIKLLPLQPRLARNLLRATLQVRVSVTNRPSNSVESKARRFCRKLDLGSNMEESKVSRNQMVCHASRLVLNIETISTVPTFKNQGKQQTYVNINLSAQHILRFLETVVCGERGTGLDFVEA